MNSITNQFIKGDIKSFLLTADYRLMNRCDILLECDLLLILTGLFLATALAPKTQRRVIMTLVI